MATFNRIALMGTLKEEPYYHSGANIESAHLLVETSEHWFNKETSEKEERFHCHPVSIYNPSSVEFIKKYFKVGDRIFIDGQLQSREFLTKEDKKRYNSLVVVPRFGGSVQYIGKGKLKESVKQNTISPQDQWGNDEIPFYD